MKKIFIFTSKFLVAGGFLYWLIHSGKLDISQTTILWKKKEFFCLLVIPTLFFCTILQNFRWWLILNSLTIHFSWLSLFNLTWIGNFFSTVLPGLVSGDILKGVYLQKKTKSPWTAVYSSLLLDRIMGLLGLFFLFLISSVFQLSKEDSYHKFFIFMIIGFLGLVGFFLFVFFPQQKTQKITAKIPVLLQKEIFTTIAIYLSIFRKNKKKIIASFLISIIIHFILCWVIYQISIFLFPQTLSFWKQALIIPLGLVVTALPISPSGIGVGHIAFDNLYNWFGFSGGATIFNIFIINQILVFLSGAIPFVFYKKQKN